MLGNSLTMKEMTARRFMICGKVQGVGFRYFVQLSARELGVTGWTANLDNGCVEVHANGTSRQLDDLESRLRTGPALADVRSVEVLEASVIAVMAGVPHPLTSPAACASAPSTPARHPKEGATRKEFMDCLRSKYPARMPSN